MKLANANQIHRKSGVALPSVAAPTTAACSRSLLSVTSLELDDVSAILRLANLLEAEKPAARALRLAHRRVALLFYESSTRTRTSFELAAKGSGSRHRADQFPILFHRKGGIAQRHRHYPARAGSGVHHPAPSFFRGALPSGAGHRAAGAECRRWHARASFPGFAGPENHAPRARAVPGCANRRSSSGHHRDHRWRHPPFPRGAL